MTLELLFLVGRRRTNERTNELSNGLILSSTQNADQHRMQSISTIGERISTKIEEKSTFAQVITNYEDLTHLTHLQIIARQSTLPLPAERLLSLTIIAHEG